MSKSSQTRCKAAFSAEATKTTGLSEEAEREIDQFIDSVHKAREQEAAWVKSDPQGLPSEIRLKEESLPAARAERQRLEDELERRRGDPYPEENPDHGAETDTLPAPARATQSTEASARDTRDDLLWPVIRQAQAQCSDPTSANAVWAMLCRLADDETPPLRASTSDGIKYEENGESRYLKKDALRQRLKRKK